jgi:hypothetical protein
MPGCHHKANRIEFYYLSSLSTRELAVAWNGMMRRRWAFTAAAQGHDFARFYSQPRPSVRGALLPLHASPTIVSGTASQDFFGPPSVTAPLTSGATPHSTQHPIVADVVVPESRKGMNNNQREQNVRQVAVDILGGMENCPIGSNAKIHLEQTEIKQATVPDEGNDAENWYHEHQNV